MITQAIVPLTNSFIGWLGGKTRLRPTILTCIPNHKCYVETFCGSATVFFGKSPKISKQEIINDLHEELVNLMKVVSGTYFDEKIRQEFISYVRNMPAARAVYEDWKAWTKDQMQALSPAQRAFRFYYCVKKGFSSHPKGGYEASPLSSNRYNMSSDFERISARFRASDAQIERKDFRDLIEKYNRSAADTFFFSDPPYFVANDTNYYDFTFKEQDHIDFKECCDDIEKNSNKFLITYDDVQEVIDLYKDYYIYRTDELIYSSSDERGKRELIKTELFISNYDIARVIHRRKKSSRDRDMFEKIKANDNRIDMPGYPGLERIK